MRREIGTAIGCELGMTERTARLVGDVAAAVPLGYDSVLALTALGLRVGGGLLQIQIELHLPDVTIDHHLYPTLAEVALSGLVPAVPALEARRSLADQLLQCFDIRIPPSPDTTQAEAIEPAQAEAEHVERADVAVERSRVEAEEVTHGEVAEQSPVEAEEVAQPKCRDLLGSKTRTSRRPWWPNGLGSKLKVHRPR